MAFTLNVNLSSTDLSLINYASAESKNDTSQTLNNSNSGDDVHLGVGLGTHLEKGVIDKAIGSFKMIDGFIVDAGLLGNLKESILNGGGGTETKHRKSIVDTHLSTAELQYFWNMNNQYVTLCLEPLSENPKNRTKSSLEQLQKNVCQEGTQLGDELTDLLTYYKDIEDKCFDLKKTVRPPKLGTDIYYEVKSLLTSYADKAASLCKNSFQTSEVGGPYVDHRAMNSLDPVVALIRNAIFTTSNEKPNIDNISTKEIKKGVVCKDNKLVDELSTHHEGHYIITPGEITNLRKAVRALAAQYYVVQKAQKDVSLILKKTSKALGTQSFHLNSYKNYACNNPYQKFRKHVKNYPEEYGWAAAGIGALYVVDQEKRAADKEKRKEDRKKAAAKAEAERRTRAFDRQRLIAAHSDVSKCVSEVEKDKEAVSDGAAETCTEKINTKVLDLVQACSKSTGEDCTNKALNPCLREGVQGSEPSLFCNAFNEQYCGTSKSGKSSGSLSAYCIEISLQNNCKKSNSPGCQLYSGLSSSCKFGKFLVDKQCQLQYPNLASFTVACKEYSGDPLCQLGKNDNTILNLDTGSTRVASDQSTAKRSALPQLTTARAPASEKDLLPAHVNPQSHSLHIFKDLCENGKLLDCGY